MGLFNNMGCLNNIFGIWSQSVSTVPEKDIGYKACKKEIKDFKLEFSESDGNKKIKNFKKMQNKLKDAINQL